MPSSLGSHIEGNANGTACVADAALNHGNTCDVALVRSEQVGRPQHGSVGTAILRLVQVQLRLRAVRPHTADSGTTQYSCTGGVRTDATLSCTSDVCSTSRILVLDKHGPRVQYFVATPRAMSVAKGQQIATRQGSL